MRLNAFLTLVAASLVAGCLSDASSDTAPGQPPADDVSTTQESRTLLLPLFQAVAADQASGPASEGSVAFDVPPGASDLAATAEWSCVTMCPLAISLLGPDGTELAHAEGWGLDLAVPEPPAGTWTAHWEARDGVSVGDYGQIRIDFQVST